MRTAAFFLLAFAAGLASFGQTAPPTPAPVHAKRPMNFEDLQAMKRVSDPQISPSGKWVMFSVTEVDLARNAKTNHLWVVSADGSGKEVQLTFGAGESSGRFAPDGTRFAFVAGGQLHLAAWDDARGRMSPATELTHIVTEADGPLWSPDGQSLAFVSEIYPQCSTGAIFDESCNQKAEDEAAHAPTKALIFDSLLYRHWNAYQGAKRSHILMLHIARPGYIYDLTPAADWGENIIAPTFSLGGPLGYAWAPDSKEFAFVVNADKVPAASTNNDIYTIDVTLHDGGTESGATGWSPKKISTSPGSDDAPAYSPDGRSLAFRSQARAGYESDRFRLMLYDRQGKTTRELLPNFDRWIDEFVWAPDSSAIYFAGADVGQEPVFRATLATSEVDRLDPVEAGPEMSLGFWAEFGSLVVSSDGKSLFATGMSVWQPAEIYKLKLNEIQYTTSPRPEENARLMHAGGQTAEVTRELSIDARPISTLNDALLESIDLKRNDMERFLFPGAGGTKVQGFLIRPPNFDPAKKYPLKFLIHGGPQGAWGDAWSYRWNAELMAASGYVVVMINPRGSTGYGQAFIDGVNGDWGGKPYIDLMKGLDYAEAHYPFIDKSRECALGASYGGFMANWILTHTNRFACIVTHDGMFNPQSAYGDTEELWFNEWEFRRTGSSNATAGPSEPGQPWKYASGPIADDPFRKWSPMLSIQNAKTPTLVIHSQRDYRLDVSEGFQLFTALQRLNVPSKMLYFPDEGHWVLKPQNSKLWYETVSDWCDKWTHTNEYAESTR
jgi:dipeptidyl aminopeptidase/acylaminoacyl peptidase